MENCKNLLYRARDIALNCAKEYGFIGPDANTTYERIDSMVMNHSARPPLMNNLSDEHDNFPPLSLSKISENYKQKLLQYSMNDFSDPYLNYNDFKYTSKDIEKFRVGPVDKESVYSPSEFSNIYLESVRYLVLCYTSLSMILDDMRCTGVNTIEYSKILEEESFCSEEGLKVSIFTYITSYIYYISNFLYKCLVFTS
jgi:hypothetical protein